jgi:hypothetical protein
VSSRSAKPLLTGDTLSLKQDQDKQMHWLIFGHWCRYLLGNIHGHIRGHQRGVLARPRLPLSCSAPAREAVARPNGRSHKYQRGRLYLSERTGSEVFYGGTIVCA